MNNRKIMPRVLITSIALAVYAILAIGSVDTSQAKCEVKNMTADNDFAVINDEFDAGVRISFTVSNVGESGKIRIAPWLSSSEGEWTREQNLDLEAGASRKLEYFFHEPTINATNLHYGCRCTP